MTISTVSTPICPEGFGAWAMAKMAARPAITGYMFDPSEQAKLVRQAIAKARRSQRLSPKERTARRKEANAMKLARRLKRAVAWADRKAVAAIYAEAARLTKQTGKLHEVDHVIPMQGRTVSGLHVETNLRAIPAIENRRKYNHY